MLPYKDFTFPLNVYSHVLLKDYGSFEYLHYGLFSADDADVLKAQQRATDLLFAHLPPNPCRILEVGIGLGTTLAKLVKAGYDVIGITPDKNQINYAKNSYGDELPAVHSRLEDLSAAQKFDLILFQESAQYIDTTAIFNKALELLTDDGQIIIMDEISLRKGSPSDPGLPLLDNYISQGQASGFELIEQLDLSSQALPTNSYLLDAVIRYRENVIDELSLSAEDIDGLIDSAKLYLAKYQDGRYGYCFLQLKKKAFISADWSIDLAKSNDEAELLNLFQASFGYQVQPELWRWKYRGLDMLGTLVRRDGRAIAFYGAMPRAIHLFGFPATAVQIGDVMVHPDERGTLTRKGAFFHAAASFLERFVGEDKAFPIAFGFPSARVFRLAARLGLYERVGELMRVSWPALQTRPSYSVRLRPLSQNPGATVDRLWLEMADALQDQVVGVRDWAYLQQRYLDHPTVDYQLYLVSSRLTGSPLGIVVTRILDDAVELLDIIAPPQRVATLIHCLRRLTWNLGKPQAYAWITTQHANLLAGETGEITPTDIIIPHNHWTPGLPASALLGRWWLMGGDTDFR
ncbi:MAG: bifunctional class I SAM-dependent methyltransferase/GNAT family N-acetyltransferase [Methylobacter sp.]|uniref:Bifunctional class I SAM-dependent methyltransferase/GNAT family N-acetyltransferase n=1 Tax=Candidatus Methylobacter titanis TaxID=3053457 RepID=A0AA43TNY8_9GAMM|nr:bifunctional class I SAM-dependent methyltransferase/GNAT family N-acetyltransferase [Candidatus Methylobacter titanis]